MKRERIAEGVYRDKYGVAATVKVGSVQREHRFPADAEMDTIQAWRARTRADLLDERPAATTERGTLAADIERFKKRIEKRTAYRADCSHLKAWAHLGKVPRLTIKPPQVQAAINAWVKAGAKPRTIRHRLRVFRELYQSLDGDHAKPPIKGLVIPKPAATMPTPVKWSVIRAVAAKLKKGLTITKAHGPKKTTAKAVLKPTPEAYARYLVRATTGQRPVQIGWAKPDDVDLERKIWFVRPAKFGNPIPLPLDAEMIKAWKVFMDANAWGEFDTSNFAKLLRRYGWPEGIRPYNLRHTFAIDLLLDGADLGDVQGFLGHKQIETTRKHYAPILLARLRKVGRLRRSRTME